MPHFDGSGEDSSIKTRVLLIRAHYRQQYRAPGFPVGIALIASYLESKGISVTILDLATREGWESALRAEFGKHSYGVAGISFQITQYEEACEIARYLKENYPATKVVFGGSFASSAPRDCINNKDIDVVCCAEGELTIYELIRVWEQGQPLDCVDGIVFRGQNGQTVQTSPRALIENLDEMPMPAYHLLDLEPYIRAEHTSDFNKRKRRCMELITSRGCPYHCIFCHAIFGKKFRGRSAQNVVNEMRLLHDRYQVAEFVIWDDTFTMDVERAKQICDLIVDSGLDIKMQLRGGVRVEAMDDELMAKLKKAGVETMCVGIESAVWRIQKMIKKNLKIEKVDALLDLAAKYRITAIGLMMLGFPGETVRDIKESYRWAAASKLDYTFFSIVTPFPGTELYDLAIRERYFTKDESLSSMNVMIPHMETPEVKSSLLKWLQLRAYIRFYLKPRRLRKLLSSTYILKTFVGSLFDYVSVALAYYRRRFSSKPRQHDSRVRPALP